MHAYLFVGPKNEALKKAGEFSQKIGKTSFEFSITKIDEVKSLLQIFKLSFNNPTTILIKDIENAKEEALNALLKTIEEPQENIKIILVASSELKLLPTIISRCQVIKVKGGQEAELTEDELYNFLNMKIGEKFIYIDKIKKRQDAINFIEKITLSLHRLLLKESGDLEKISKILNCAHETYKNLKANGNVNLQLTSFVVKIS